MSGTPSAHKETTNPSNAGDAYLRSLSSVAQGAADKPTQMRAGKPVQPVKGKRRGKGKGRPETNLRRLAGEHSQAAFLKVVELMDDSNSCVAIGAAQTVLGWVGGKPTVKLEHLVTARPSTDKELRVSITRFNKE